MQLCCLQHAAAAETQHTIFHFPCSLFFSRSPLLAGGDSLLFLCRRPHLYHYYLGVFAMSNPNKTVGSQLAVLFKLALPIIMGNFAYAILGITDVMMAGMAGTPDQAGVAIGGSFYFPAITFVIGMVSALHPVISRHCGANTKEQIPQAHAHAVWACLSFSVVIMLILLGLAFFAIDMDTSQRMEDVARYYVVCVALTIPVNAFYITARAYCEAMGDTKATLYFGVLAVVLNVPLNYVFIFGKFGMPALGGIGCGVATVISLTLSTIIIFIYMLTMPQLKDYSWLKNKSGVSKHGVWDYIKLSVPLGISSSVECSCFALIALLLSPLGPTIVSAHTITMSLTSFVFNIPLSLGIATAIMVGYAIGQNNLNTLRLNIKAAYAAMGICVVVSVSILALGRNFLPTLFSEDMEVLALASVLMLFGATNQLFEGPQTMQAFILRGFKDTKTILGVTIVAFYCVALPIGITLCYGYLPVPDAIAGLFGEQGLTGPRGFWVGLFFGLFSAAVLYRLRVVYHYRKLKAEILDQETAGTATAGATGAAKSAQAAEVAGAGAVTGSVKEQSVQETK